MIVADLITQTAAEGGCRFAFELLPPLKGDGTQGVFGAIDHLVEFDPAYIDVTFHREVMHTQTLADGRIERHVARRRPGTVGISAAIREKYGIETVPHIICGGLSRYDIEDMLIDMDFLGLHNVLALRGDKSPDEDYFTPHPQGHAHAIDLVRQIMAMNRGEFVDGEVEQCHHSEFSIGVAGYPEKHSGATSIDEDIAYLKQKVDAGARYVVTQLFFDNAKFFDYRERCRKAGINVPIIPGIKPFAVARHLEILPRIFGTAIPEELEREVRRYIEDPKAVREIGSEWCIAQCRELKAAGVPVLHFYTMSRTEEIARIARAIF
ncbi:MAG: methylenetetrahydrofolate reductase [Alistipes sp.]|nr:methylenetetrahydrofolate reductase [Alistipes sp.]